MTVSDCCGAAPRIINGDSSTEDMGICPKCRDHCEYIEEEETGQDKEREEEKR